MKLHEITADVGQGDILPFSSLNRAGGSHLGYLAMKPHVYALNIRSYESSQNKIVFLKVVGLYPLTSISKGHCAPLQSLLVTATGFLKPAAF